MPKAKAQLTEKQVEVKALLEKGQNVEQVAKLMDTTTSVIKAQVSRIRSAGYEIQQTGETELTTKTPGSVEEHIKDELTQVEDRLVDVTQTIADLSTEHTTLEERREQLRDASKALGAPIGEVARPPLAAVS